MNLSSFSGRFLNYRRFAPALLLLAVWLPATRAHASDDWQQKVHAALDQRQIPVAMSVVEHRLAESPEDMEAHSWRGRLLAWTGHWQEAATEYHVVLDKFPNDVDVLNGLADVLLWQQKYSEALAVLDVARSAAPQDPETLVRRARVLSLLQRAAEARAQYQAVLAYDPGNRAAKDGLTDLELPPRYNLRIGNETDYFNYTGDAQMQGVALTARWNERWASTFGINPYHLFGENAVKFWADTARRFHQNNWVRVAIGGANPQDVVPECEGLVEFGHGFRFSNPWFKGLESTYQEHSLWYRGARVLTLSTTQITTLPKEWTWTLTVTGSRTHFPGTGSDWVPSGLTKVEFPLLRSLSGNLMFAVGAENFAQVDEIGRLSARTYGGGWKYRLGKFQEVAAFVARQDREHGQKLTSLGLNYGIRF
jgi:tetratricopeptide (TPR) repeat protein